MHHAALAGLVALTLASPRPTPTVPPSPLGANLRARAPGARRPLPPARHAAGERRLLARRHARGNGGPGRLRRRRGARRRPRGVPVRGPRRALRERRDRRELRHRRLREVRPLHPRRPVRQGRRWARAEGRAREVQPEGDRGEPVERRAARRRSDRRQPAVAARDDRRGLREATRVGRGAPRLLPQPQGARGDREDAGGGAEDREHPRRGAVAAP